MVLSSVEIAALTALFNKKRGRFALTAKQRAALMAFCQSSERTASELPLDIPEAAEESVHEEWREFAMDAGLSLVSDVNGVARWAIAKAGIDAGRPDARAASVLDLLHERGVTVSASVQAEVTATLREVGDFGDVRAQATSSLAICILYTGELPGEEIVAWHAIRARALVGGSGKVDLRSSLVYQKLHKNTSKTTLERALLDRDASNRKLATVKDAVTGLLYAASLPLAATRWQQVLGWAAQHFRHDPAKEKVYLWGYFFSTYLGLGMPEERDRDTLIDMSAPVPGGGASAIESEMRPTIPGELVSPAGVAQLGSVGGATLPGSGLTGSIGEIVLQQQQSLALLARALAGQGLRDGGSDICLPADSEPAIKELPPPKPVAQKCKFCHTEHDLSVLCGAAKQALRLKSDWDKEQARARKAGEAAGPALPALGRGAGAAAAAAPSGVPP